MLLHGRCNRLLSLVVGAALGVGGCSWKYNEPPLAAPSAPPPPPVAAAGGAVVIGYFESPKIATVMHEDIGPGMSEALAGTLFNRGQLNVWIDPVLTGKVMALMREPAEKRVAGLAKLHRQHPGVAYVITGRVTDFAHTTDLARDLRRWGPLGRRREAVVALRLIIIDLESGRVVGTDHVSGTADAPATPAAELYTNVAFGSYVFWHTPLGRASEAVVERATDMLQRYVPQSAPPLMVAEQIGPREVRLSTPITDPEARRQTYEVLVVDPGTERLAPVLDPDSGLPLTARPAAGEGAASTAWLVGQKPDGVDLSGAARAPGAVDGDAGAGDAMSHAEV